MSQTVADILQRILLLPAEERRQLDEQLTRLAETEWKREAEEARRVARQKGIDQSAIDRAVEKVRYGS